jgi:DNA polymerase-4
MLAKIAANIQKPDGLVEIRREDVKDLLENLPVEKLHGIGERLRVQLERMGIFTAGQLGRTPKNILKLKFGVLGEALHEMGNGVYSPAIVPYYDKPDIKSVSHSYTLSRNTRNMDLVQRHLLRLSEMVGRRLREQGFAGKTITLVIRYADMHFASYRRTFNEYFDDGFGIYRAALSIFNQHSDRRAIRLVGVCVSSLAKNVRQMDLFTDPRGKNLLKAVDAINDKYGEFTVKRASLVGIKALEKTHGFDKKSLF